MISNTIKRIVLSSPYQTSVLGTLTRRFVQTTRHLFNYSVKFIVDSQASTRPHYSYCMYNSAVLAKSLGLSRISAIEFGVAGGNGLKYMVDFAQEISKSLGVTIDCYGFDTGKGMPPPDGALDLPYWFQPGQYAMNQGALAPDGLLGKVILGDVKETAGEFVAKHNPAPVGVVFGDLDYWSSTRDSFKLLESAKNHPQNFMPRLFMYFDDIIGTEVEMYGPFNGQLAAINDFNTAHADMKIHLNQNLLQFTYIRSRFQIYYAHLFSHPSYQVFVGKTGQDRMEGLLKYKKNM
jgi:hypothetical protein